MSKVTYAAKVPLFILLANSVSLAFGQAPEAELQAYAERASREALAVLEDPASSHAAVADHLFRVSGIVRSGYLASETITRIRDATRLRLRSTQHYSVVTRAIDLAAALGDTSTLERIANDPREVEKLGFTEPGMIARIQQKARDHLTGSSAPL